MSQNKKGIAQEFIEFISRGNVVDLAVGVIIGGAFTSTVNSLVSAVIQPLISAIGGNPEVKGLCVSLNGQTIDFGAFISSIVSFLITALAVFAIIKSVNAFNDLKNKAFEKTALAALAPSAEQNEAPKPRTCPYCLQEIANEATRCPHCTSKLEGYRNAVE